MRTDLTDRQRRVLGLIAQGKTNFEVAQELGITLDGAKWHLREIMAKLGCDSREEAVAIWRSRPSGTRRFVQAAMGLASAASSTVARTVVLSLVAVVTIAVAVIAVTLRGGDTGPNSRWDRDAESDGAPIAGTSVSIRSCGTTAFQRPSIVEMARPFSLTRFGGPLAAHSDRPAPEYFSFYLRGVYQFPEQSFGEDFEAKTLSGVQQNIAPAILTPAAIPCDSAFRDDHTQSRYELWFIDMVPNAARVERETLTVSVDYLPGSFTDIFVTEPAGPSPAASGGTLGVLSRIKELRVVDPLDHVVFSAGAAGIAQYNKEGGLVFASSATGAAPVIEFEVRDQPLSVAIYMHEQSGNAPVSVRDGSGIVWDSDIREPAPSPWVEVFRRELPTGVYRLNRGPALILPANTTLP